LTTHDFNLQAHRAQTRDAVGFVLLSGILNSFGGLILRNIEHASEWQIILFRTGSLSLALLVVLLVRNPRSFPALLKNLGFWGGVCALLFCCMQTLFVFSLRNTTVANTVFILSSGPIWTAILARLVLGERIDRTTWCILVVAALGIGLMVGDGLSAGNLFGNLAALFGALSFAGVVVILRAKRTVDMMPSMVAGGFLAVAVAFIGTGGNLSIPVGDMTLALIWGGVLSSLVIVLFVISSRHLKGAELTLLLMFEYFLAPFWVWIFMDEVPSGLTLAGGAIVLSGVMAQAYLTIAGRKAA
jgi:drug/metabolite transporter (DMT)-like permease